MIDNSLITLNENAVENNIAFLKKKLGDKVKISAVIKANVHLQVVGAIGQNRQPQIRKAGDISVDVEDQRAHLGRGDFGGALQQRLTAQRLETLIAATKTADLRLLD